MPPAAVLSQLSWRAQLGVLAADSGDAASSRVTWVIAGLVALAAVITIATVVFWRLTRPGSDGGARWVQHPSAQAVPDQGGEETNDG